MVRTMNNHLRCSRGEAINYENVPQRISAGPLGDAEAAGLTSSFRSLG